MKKKELLLNFYESLTRRNDTTNQLMLNIYPLPSPFLKWVGGKRQIIHSIVTLLPKNIESYKYIEPFVGGGAVLFHLQPKQAIINDCNTELINVYQVIKNNVEELIVDLKKHKNESAYFYQLRGLDRANTFSQLTPVERASRIIYLNKTCFNGLYRVNNAGQFNTPFGRYKNPNIINQDKLRAVHTFLNANDIDIFSGHYSVVLEKVDKHSFVYIDPPYHPLSATANFTGYIRGGWGSADQIELRKTCDALHEKGVKFLLSNAAADFITDQYKHYRIDRVKANRSVNSDAAKRGAIDEVLIRNYE
jgi:DNA adenine methylase